MDPLRNALAKQTKAELVEALVELARDDVKTMRRLKSQFNVQVPEANLVAATRQAIADATDFDERQINYNFDYDYQAYDTVKRNLKRLVKEQCFEQAMELSLELMREGSYQVEMSDEGLMTDEIETCLQTVINALKRSDLPAQRIVEWCSAMKRADRVGFVCDRELTLLSEASVSAEPR